MRNAMTDTAKRRTLIAATAIALAVGGAAGTAWAERDPAYAAARSAGQVGEKTDGYLGLVGVGNQALKDMVDDLNIKRKAVYAEKAKVQHATLEEYAFTSGCLLISQTQPGEKYQGPDGSWKTRTAAAPERDPRCP